MMVASLCVALDLGKKPKVHSECNIQEVVFGMSIKCRQRVESGRKDTVFPLIFKRQKQLLKVKDMFFFLSGIMPCMELQKVN